MFSSKITTTCLIAAEAVVGVAAGGVGGPGIAVRAELQPLITIVADMTRARALRTIARKPRSENTCVPSFSPSMFCPKSMEFENTVNFAFGFRPLLTVWVLRQELPQAATVCEKGLGYLFTPCRKVSKGKREALPRKPLQEFGWVVAGRK